MHSIYDVYMTQFKRRSNINIIIKRMMKTKPRVVAVDVIAFVLLFSHKRVQSNHP